MHLAFTLYFFLMAASGKATSVAPRATIGDIWGGINITQNVLQVAGVISSPTCNATLPCVNLTTIEIPVYLKVLGDPGCWCSNTNPIHYCAICMSSPTDNTTTPDQTQAAGAGHWNYHIRCNAYQAFCNGSSTPNGTSLSSSSLSTSTSPTLAVTNSGSKSVSTGMIGGIVVGGLIGLVLIAAAVFLIYHLMQHKHKRIVEVTQRVSFFSAPLSKVKPLGGSPPPNGYSPPPNSYMVPLNPHTHWEGVPYDTRLLNQHPVI